jgi:hypothetical protein
MVTKCPLKQSPKAYFFGNLVAEQGKIDPL